jgi:hypothetical protein
MTLKSALRGLALAGCLAGLAAPSAAQEPTFEQLLSKTPPEDLARAFKGICLDHPGDMAGQAAAAQAAPWLMKKESVEAGQTTYTNWPTKAHIGKRDGRETCIVITAIEDATTIADIEAKALPLLGAPTAFELRNESTLGWEFERDGERYMVMYKTFQNPGLRTGIFLLGRIRGR